MFARKRKRKPVPEGATETAHQAFIEELIARLKAYSGAVPTPPKK